MNVLTQNRFSYAMIYKFTAVINKVHSNPTVQQSGYTLAHLFYIEFLSLKIRDLGCKI